MNSLSIKSPLFSLSHTSVAYDLQDYSRILLKGPDAKLFLHRLSTNAVTPSKRGDSCLNALLNQKGRMIDLLHQIILADDEILLIAGPHRGPEILAWFDQFLFVEKVELEDISQEGGLICVIGKTPFSGLEKWESQFNGNQIVMRSFDFVDENLHQIPSFLVYDRQSKTETLLANFSVTPVLIDFDLFATARIAAGICACPNEINDTFNPLELSLNDAIHWDKGCYIGQEVVSRLYTYQKRSKELFLVSVSEKNARQLKSGQSLQHQGQTIGQLTSVSPFYWPNHANALAVIKQKSEQETTKTAIIATDSQEIEVSLIKIPS